MDFAGNIFGNAYAPGEDSMGCTISGNVYANYRGVAASAKLLVTGKIGYDANNVAKANTYDFTFANAAGSGSFTDVLVLNAKIPASPVFNSRNNISYIGRYKFEHRQQVVNAHYIADAFGDLTKASSGWTGTPPSQAANCLKVANIQTNIGATTYLDVITKNLFRVWQKAGTVVYKVYVQAPTANNSNYAAADLVFYADYLDQVSGGHLATANSTGGITRANAWTQSLTVSVTSAADGWVSLYLRLFKFYNAADVFYVDPGLWSGGNLLVGDWSQGELVYPGGYTGIKYNPGMAGGLR